MTEFLREYGEKLVDAGYSIIPIPPGKKSPNFDGWQTTRSSRATVASWLKKGRNGFGIGILTAYTPAIDIDVMDEAMADRVEKWCVELFGKAPVRVGQAPKRLMVFKTSKPFRKMASSVWFDEWDEKQQIEVLGDGQQFVAYHVHPETRLPYQWVRHGSPETISASDLIELDVQKVQELLFRFDTVAKEQGWDMRRSARRPVMPGHVALDDPFVEDTPPVDLTLEEIRERLLMLPDEMIDDHDTWFQVGMALFHQFAGSEEGLDLWHEWSEPGATYDREVLDYRWSTFDIGGKMRSPTTARYIIKLAQEATDAKAQQDRKELRTAFTQATDEKEWQQACKKARNTELDFIARQGLAGVVQESYQRVTGMKLNKPAALKAIEFELNTKDVPRWCRNWVYDAGEDRFVNIKSKFNASQQGFNAMHDRHAMTKKEILDGQTKPNGHASDKALNLYQIPVVHGERFCPGQDAIFRDETGRYVNTYSEVGIPAVPDNPSPRDKRNIERVKGHVEHLLADEREQALFLDWIAFVATRPGQRVNWAVMLQGVEGDGKSFWAVLMRAVMGFSNVRVINGSILEERFTDWAEGQCLVCVEEIRMIGHNRYDALNRVKPMITNDVIEVHPKGKPSRDVMNTSNYLLFTNYQDALPLDDNSRRYFVLFSRWQRKADLQQFERENPSYYTRLYAAIAESAGAIRGWLLDYEFSDWFLPGGQAPMTEAQAKMAQTSRPAFIDVLEETISDEEIADISNDVLNITRFVKIFETDYGRSDVPPMKRLNHVLESVGFYSIGRFRYGGSDKNRFYSRTIDPLLPVEKIKKEMDKCIERNEFIASKRLADAGVLDPLDDL